MGEICCGGHYFYIVRRKRFVWMESSLLIRSTNQLPSLDVMLTHTVDINPLPYPTAGSNAIVARRPMLPTGGANN